MSDESRAATINKLSIRYGLIIGVISIVLTLIFWVIDPLMQYTNSWVSFLVFVIMIVLLVVFGIETRKAAGGYWTFGEAFKSLLLMSVIVSILTAVFNYILFAFIDPTLSQRASEAVITKLNDQLSSSGISQDKIDEMSKSVEGKLQPTITNMGVNLGIGLVIYAVIDLIIAAIIKKNPPLFAPVDDDVTV
jgi:hypothetical protein